MQPSAYAIAVQNIAYPYVIAVPQTYCTPHSSIRHRERAYPARTEATRAAPERSLSSSRDLVAPYRKLTTSTTLVYCVRYLLPVAPCRKLTAAVQATCTRAVLRVLSPSRVRSTARGLSRTGTSHQYTRYGMIPPGLKRVCCYALCTGIASMGRGMLLRVLQACFVPAGAAEASHDAEIP
eukprot:3470377-Rhodomonas_salina.2